MKHSILVAGLSACLILPILPAVGAEPAAATPPAGAAKSPQATGVASELREIVNKVREKMKGGQVTEADLADELKAFDALLAKHKDEKTDEMAQVLMMKASLYSQVLKDEAKGDALMETLKKDYPDTKVVEGLKKREASEKIRKSLKVGSKFPDFQEKDTEGNPLSIARFKGKVLLVDFWATWCGPCVAELPTVMDAYKKYHADGFEILGISLDQSEEKLKSFLKEKEMTWPQYFDGKGWQCKLAGQYGINSIPATFLLDGQGNIIATDLRGEALGKAVAKALGK